MSQYCEPAVVNVPGLTSDQKLPFILEASAEADSYVGKRKKLPLLSWGADLSGAVRRMSRYYAFGDRGFDPANAADQAVVKQYTDAIAWLKQVATGDAELVDAVDSSASTEEAAPLHDGEAPHRWLWGSSSAEEDE